MLWFIKRFSSLSFYREALNIALPLDETGSSGEIFTVA
jgi:hypothetical protein